MGRVLYWVGNAGRADDPAHYSLSPNGPGGEALPTNEDELIIGPLSFTMPGQYILFPLMIDVLLPIPALIMQPADPSVEMELIAETPIDLDITLAADDIFDDPLDMFPAAAAIETWSGRTCTVSCPAVPAVVVCAGHGCAENTPVYFTVNSGVIADEITAFTLYYAKIIDDDSFNLMVTPDGTPMDTTGIQTATVITLWTRN